MKGVILLLIVAGLLSGCSSSSSEKAEIEMKNGKKYRCVAIWGDESGVDCYVGNGQSFPMEMRQIRWFTSHR